MRIGTAMRAARLIAALLAGMLAVSGGLAQTTKPQKPLEQMSGEEILRCAYAYHCDGMDWEIANALRGRFSSDELIRMYPTEREPVRSIIVYALFHDKGPRVTAFMRQVAFANLRPGMTDEDNNYFPLQYLARQCDSDALRELNRPANFTDEGYPISCMQWESTLSAFGKCGYQPALSHLAVSLNSACLNNTASAEESLRKLLPRSECWKLAGKDGDFWQESQCYLRDIKAGHVP